MHKVVNSVGVIQDHAGNLLTSDDDIRLHATDFIRNLFLDECTAFSPLPPANISFPELTSMTQDWLDQKFNEEELRQAIKAMAPL